MTEQEFVVELIKSLIGNREIEFTLGSQWKGNVSIQSVTHTPNPEFFVLVVDCCSDGQVKTQILERYSLLVSSGYTTIIGLRDVYPLLRSDIPKLKAGIAFGMPHTPIAPTIHLAEMETEAWFLAEATHFARIDDRLTIPFIDSNGILVSQTSADQWPHPTKVLDDIYSLSGRKYLTRGKKKKNRVQRTLRALSVDEFYINVRPTLPALNAFITEIETALF